MKVFVKSVMVLCFLFPPHAATAQSIVINLPRLIWPTTVSQGCTDMASLAEICVPGQ